MANEQNDFLAFHGRKVSTLSAGEKAKVFQGLFLVKSLHISISVEAVELAGASDSIVHVTRTN